MTLKPGKIMFIDTVHPVLKEELNKLGFSCEDFTTKQNDEIFSLIPDYQGVVIRSKFTIDKQFLQTAKKLEFIARSGSGLENIDVDAAKKRGIQCFNSPEGNQDAVAEHCIGMLLTLFNKIIQANSEVKKGLWQREANRGIELKGKTIGLIGYGKMATAFAERLHGFGVEVIAYDNKRINYSSNFVKEVSKQQLQNDSDVISLHVNYTEENFHLIDSKFINECSKPFFLLNTSRGKCVDTESLILALENRKILGACLDVLEIESSSFNQREDKKAIEQLRILSSFNNVILTPHVAGWTTESYYKLSEVLAKKIKAHYKL